jgi:hypothetical protein
MHKNRVKILSSIGIPFDLRIYLPCRGQDGLGILHSKLVKNVLNVLGLADEGVALELLDLKS